MNIALIGAPGSGKTSLAYRLRREIEVEDPSCNCKRSVAIVDNYIPEIERETNLGLGSIAGYLGNIYVALGRYARERVARDGHDSVVTCGTLVETAVYTAMHFVSLTDVLSDEEKLIEAPRIEATLRMLACLYTDVCTYDYAFYLPPPVDGDEVEAAFFDQQLQAALQGFKLVPVTPLLDRDTQLADALKALKEGDAVQTS